MKKLKFERKETKKQQSSGITLIALVITIIVLLILAAISLTMLTGDNSILQRAGQARDKTKESQKDEEVKVAVLGSYDDRANLDIDKLLSNLNEIKDITVTPTQENGTNTFPVKVETEYTTYEITSDGNFEEVVIADRTGISVGDYITYISPTASVTFSEAETGYSGKQDTLKRKTLFRVMDIDSRGNMTLIGSMTSKDPTIYFSGAQGYNNAVSVLNNKCSELYKDTSKGITARSINEEDITKRFNIAGKKKITDDIDGQVGTETTSGSLKIGSYITAVDGKNKTVTYKTRTNYPNIFQYEEGGKIGDTATSGELSRSAKPLTSIYGTDEILTSADKDENNNVILQSSKSATTLTVPCTDSFTTHTADDFDNSEGKASAWQNMFFGTGTSYWLASRCIYCYSDSACFDVCGVYNSSLGDCCLYGSGDDTNSLSDRVCPVVYLPSSVQVEISPSTDKSVYHEKVPHVVK